MNALYEADGLGYSDFYQGSTRRVISLIKKSPTFRTLVTHPVTRAACDATLKPSCVAYQVHATAAFWSSRGQGRRCSTGRRIRSTTCRSRARTS